MRIAFGMGLCVLAFSATAAVAADWNTVPLRPSVAPQDGFTIGLIGGYQSATATFSSPWLTGSVSDSLAGWDGGGVVGYEFHQDGYFSAFEVAGFFGGPTKTYADGPVSLTYGLQGHIDGRVRGGAFVSDRLALGGIVGLSYNRVTTEVTDGVDTYSGSEWQWGWLVGASADLAVTDRISLGVEYTYNQLFSRTYYDLVTVGGNYHALRAATRIRF